MVVLQKNIYTPLSLAPSQSIFLVDMFDGSGKKTIELAPHSSFTYLIVARHADIDIDIVTT